MHGAEVSREDNNPAQRATAISPAIGDDQCRYTGLQQLRRDNYFLHEHYETLAEKAKTQQQQQSITLPYESFDFSTNNAKFWLRKLQSKEKMLDQFSYRNIDIDTLRWGLTNIQLIEALIKLGQEKSSSE